MANTFRDKKTEEGLDESMRSTTTRHTEKQHNEAASTVSAPSGNQFRKPAEPAHEETPNPTTTNDTEPSAAQSVADTPSTQKNATTASRHTDKPSPKKKKGENGNLLGNIFGGEILRSKWLSKQRGVIAILVAFCFILVTNRYYVETLVTEQHATKERIKYLREERIQMKKNYQENVKISHIVSKLDSIDVGLIAGPPNEIVIDKQKNRRNRE